MELSDREAVERARKGDPSAFRVLVERNGRPRFRLAFRMVGNEEDAEDVVQETFLRAYKQLHRYDGRASFSTWLSRIATNYSLDLIRSRKSRREQPPPVTVADAEDPLDRMATDAPSPERLAHSGQIAGLLEPALRRLTDLERAAFVLRHYEDCHIEEIAARLGVQNNAARHTVYRAVQKLRRALLPVWGMAR